ncbi:hypothetical protein VZT92_003896 [Zoarces viviparus]|uniref:Uncharacterized protein n=1 Tax=Zoarces viviparus TaxID=48416 RepID=A0AAW1FVJ9_ZOAVI
MVTPPTTDQHTMGKTSHYNSRALKLPGFHPYEKHEKASVGRGLCRVVSQCGATEELVFLNSAIQHRHMRKQRQMLWLRAPDQDC